MPEHDAICLANDGGTHCDCQGLVRQVDVRQRGAAAMTAGRDQSPHVERPAGRSQAPLRLVIEFDRQWQYDEFLYEHDPRVGRSCSDVTCAYRVVTADDAALQAADLDFPRWYA